MDRELEKWALQQARQLTADWTAQESDEQKAIRQHKMGVNEKKGGSRIANYTFTRVGYRSVRMTQLLPVNSSLADVVHEI
jgi:hypothetical protein